MVIVQNESALTALHDWPDGTFNCCVTSPPYWGLRDYGVEGQLGLEKTPEEYVAKLVEIMSEVRRVLRDDGTLWLNLGDSYARDPGKSGPDGRCASGTPNGRNNRGEKYTGLKEIPNGAKAKDLVGIPWLVAFALRASGWYLRQDIIWHKPNPMPESVRDRCTKAHEYLFLLVKSPKYYYDSGAIKEPCVKGFAGSEFNTGKTAEHQLGRASNKPRKAGNKNHKYVTEYNGSATEEHRTKAGLMDCAETEWETRNRRDVWTIATQPYPEAHFATFPPALVEPCILAGCPPDGWVLDPFAGSGTTLAVAEKHGRNAVGVELKEDYCLLIDRRLEKMRAAL